MIILLIAGLIKKILYKMSQYFPKPYEPFGGDINVEVDLSNYEAKPDIKNITHVDTLGFALKINLANSKTKVDKLDIDKLKNLPNNLSSLKTKVDKLDIDKLISVPVDLSKLRNVIKNQVVKKTEYNAKIKNIEDKIPDISNLATKTILNTKINEFKNKVPSITSLATTSELTAVESKIPSVSNLVRKTDYNAKVSDIEKKITDHITTAANFVKKTDFDNKLSSLNKKIVLNKAKDIAIENKLKNLKALDSNYYNGKNYFNKDGIQNYLVFQSILNNFTLDRSWTTKWESKRLYNKSLEVVSTSSNTLTPSVSYYREKVRLKFTGSVLQQKIVTYRHRKVVNLYAVYEITNFHDINNYPTLANALFGAVKLTKNADIGKYKYSGYGIGFDEKLFFSHPSGRTGRNVIIFGVDVSSSTKIDNKGKHISIVGLGPTFGLGEKALSAEKLF